MTHSQPADDVYPPIRWKVCEACGGSINDHQVIYTQPEDEVPSGIKICHRKECGDKEDPYEMFGPYTRYIFLGV